MIETHSLGAIYCAIYDKKFLSLSILSALELRRFNPFIPVRIVTDITLVSDTDIQNLKNQGIELFIVKIGADKALESRIIKTNIIEYSPFETTIYIDSDILPMADYFDLLHVELNDNALAICRERKEEVGNWSYINTPDGKETTKICGNDFPLYGGGFLIFKKTPEMKKFFTTWFKEWTKFRNLDQWALARTIKLEQTPIVELPTAYNFNIDRFWESSTDEKVINLHVHAFYTRPEKVIALYKTLSPESYSYIEKVLPLD